ncbi:MAG: GIY-YIG nuclease family protein [Balneolaceae bacterium]|nr:GIY-YIG nuclease family protein [Balneolaceae bacterium]
MKPGYMYILANKHRTVFYTGVTSALINRIYQHKFEKGSKFTSKYNVHDLMYYTEFPSMYEAIAAEKRVKKWKRAWKIELIKTINPEMKDLWEDIYI